MNSTEHSTGSPAAPDPANPTDAQVADAMRDLENDIRELMLMADIAANAWDNIGPPKQFCENGFRYECTRLERDSFDFLINNVAVRANDLRNKFDAAANGEVLS